MSNNDIQKILDLLLQLGVHEQEVIASFEKRISSLRDHRKDVIRLIDAISDKIAGKDVSLKPLIDKIEKDLKVAFEEILKYKKEEEEIRKKELALRPVEDSIFTQELALIQKAYAEGKPGDALKEKLSALSQQVALSLELKRTEWSIEEELARIVNSLAELITREQANLDIELDVLQSLERAGKEELEWLKTKLAAAASNLYQLVYEEKSRIVEPLNKFLKEKISVVTKLKRLVSKYKKITLADIKKDLRTLTTPEEVLEYLSRLHAYSGLLDDACKATLSRYGTMSLYKLKTTFFERAWESITDPLTRLFNRRYFDRDLKKRFMAAQQLGAQLSIIFFDIDDFKQINDKYGHDIGDAVLKIVSNSIASLKRREDLLCRFGGEEFVLAVFANQSDAYVIAERIKASLEEKTKEILPKLGIYDRAAVTVSGGVATFKGTGLAVSEEKLIEALNLTIKASDGALLAAKRTGKNRIRL
ncbi:MAG: GGDEF domain-containing protein, partial [Candidatus Woesearchaeota archaeon]